MDAISIRPFRRSDREQVTALIEAHARAVMPGASVSVNAMMSQLEGEPAEYVVDPWVRKRRALVAELRSRVVGAAYLQLHGTDPNVGEDYRGMGYIRWLVFWPRAPLGPYTPDPSGAGSALLEESCRLLIEDGAREIGAGGELPVPGVYGVPEQWQHIRETYAHAGFAADAEEVLYHASPAAVEERDPPTAALVVKRSVGVNGTRMTATSHGQEVGYIETDLLDTPLGAAEHALWADIGNLELRDADDDALARWLIGKAAAWLRLAGVDHLLAYAGPEEATYIRVLTSLGFAELTRTLRGWSRSVEVVNGPMGQLIE